jgi:thiosulfate dehydrogenase [quinone] large subunit
LWRDDPGPASLCKVTSSQTQRRGTPPSGLRARLRSDPRFTTTGWVLLPLRAFLGFTFVYAGVSKLFDVHYLDPSSPLGVHAQMLHAAATSPIGGLVSLSAEHATITGLLIAFGEIAAGLGALLGLLTRLAALGGLLLAFSFFLTVSWSTRPYYFGADIVFAFAWTPLVIAGDGGLLSVTAWLRAAARQQLGLAPEPTARETVVVRNEVERRAVVRSAGVAAVIGAVSVIGGSVLALVRRPSTAAAATPAPTPKPSATASGAAPSATASPTATGKVIAAAASVPVGSSKSFTGPDGAPAFLLHPAADTFLAFSAICSHQGCPVSYVGPGFQCPCHGATYDQNGQVTGGPAPSPLTKIPVKVTGGSVATA